MIKSSRRTFLGASALLPLAATGGRAASPAGKTIEADLLRYVRFGNKRAGGPGDLACGEWMAGKLESAGYAVERRSFAVPYFEPTAAEHVSEGPRSPVHPQPTLVPTGPGGVSGPLVRGQARGRPGVALTGAIAPVD